MGLPHPLSQLSEQEFTKARDIVIKAHGSADALCFRSIFRQEPPKSELIPFLEAEHAGSLTDETTRPARCARVEYDVVKPNRHEYHRAVVNVETGEVLATEPAGHTSFPYFTVAEFSQFEDICAQSELFKEAMSEFELPEGFDVTIDPWPYGGAETGDEPKIMQGLVFAKDASKKNDDTNHYAYPIPIVPVMNWATKELIRVDRLARGGSDDSFEGSARADKPKKLFANSHSAEYVPELLDLPMRHDLKPLNVVQPEGASFTIQSDGLVEWQKWRFRVDFSPREGAVLHDITYENRPVVYRLSFSELTVPYADPRAPFQRKQAFDFGDGGGGRAANNLELGCDCLGAIHYVDGILAAPDGSPTPAKNVICLHEQDNGILWKHTNFRTNRAVVARSRELVIQSICTLANYEYIFAFKLDLAGEITLETRATGILSVVGIDEGKTTDWGNVVAPGILAQNHQHIFAARIDPAIDSYKLGDCRVVVEESHPLKTDPKTNPYGNRYEVQRKPVRKATWIDADTSLNRVIKIENPNIKNEMSGRSVAYKLVNPPTQMMLADKDSPMAKRAQFAHHHNWVTGYRDNEYFVAGEFTNQSTSEVGGVGDMVARGDWFSGAEANGSNGAGNGAAKESSPVIWAVFGLTHNPRVEDWPVMPVEIHQMRLRPADFFNGNPALDVPSARNNASVLVPCCGSSIQADAITGDATVQENPLSHRQGTRSLTADEAGAHVESKNGLGHQFAELLNISKQQV